MRKLGNQPDSPLGRSHMFIRSALQVEMDLDQRTWEKAEHMGVFWTRFRSAKTQQY